MTAADVRLKLALLEHGVTYSRSFLAAFGAPFLEKRRAYNNTDRIQLERPVPQEILIGEGPVVAAVHGRPRSPLALDHAAADGFVVRIDGDRVPVSFPIRPAFYGERIGRRLVQNVITLYGGRSLGIFVNGSCHLVDIGKPCGYCSIGQNHLDDVDFVHTLSPKLVKAAVSSALQDEAAPIEQVMLNGGNFAEPDGSFRHYARIVSAAREAIDESERDVELHLIVYPPENLSAIDALSGLGVSVAMNTEVHDPDLFERLCPGKAQFGGQARILGALERAVAVLGQGHVYSIFVGGLEPPESLAAGMRQLVDIGVVPVVNVFHADPGTPLEDHPTPTVADMEDMGRALSHVYREAAFEFVPFYWGCGRNALDTEAKLGLFA